MTVQTALPWADDVCELIDEIAAEKLPGALMDPVLEQRRARHAERRAAIAAKAAAIERIAELAPGVAELDGGALDELERLNVVAHGEYSVAAWELRDKIGARRKQLSAAAETASHEPTDQAPHASGGEELQNDVDADELVPTRTSTGTTRTPVRASTSRGSTRADCWGRRRGLCAPEDRTPSGGAVGTRRPRHRAGATNSTTEARHAKHQPIALTDEERAERRKREQQLTEQAVAQLRCSEGWQRWLMVRAQVGLRRYSVRNQLLICLQRAGSHCLLGRGGVDMWSSRACRPVGLAGMGISGLGSARWRGRWGSLNCL